MRVILMFRMRQWVAVVLAHPLVSVFGFCLGAIHVSGTVLIGPCRDQHRCLCSFVRTFVKRLRAHSTVRHTRRLILCAPLANQALGGDTQMRSHLDQVRGGSCNCYRCFVQRLLTWPRLQNQSACLIVCMCARPKRCTARLRGGESSSNRSGD